MLEMLLSLPGPLAGGLVVVCSVAATLGGLALVRRRFTAEDLRSSNEITGLVFVILGGIYGVLLAFVLVAVWEDFGRAEEHVEAEVTRLGTLHRDAHVFPEPERAEVREALAGYVRSVVEDEWPAMADGNYSPRTLAAYDRVWAAYYGLDPGGGNVDVFYEQSVDRLAEVGESRRSRILASRSGVPGTMWLLLVAGAFVMAGVSFLLAPENPVTHSICVSALAGVVAAVLFVTVALEHPFAPGISISTRPYVELADQWATTR